MGAAKGEEQFMNALPDAASGRRAEGAPTAYPWFVVVVLLIVGIVSYLDRNIIALLIEPIKADLGITDTGASLLQGTAFAVFFVAFGYPSGILVDRANRRNLLVFGVALWSLMTAAGGLATSFWELFAARAGVGIGEAFLAPAAFSLIADYFAPAERGRAMSTYNMANYLGGGGSMLVGGLVLRSLGGLGASQLPLLGETANWKATLIIIGLPGILLAGLLFAVREPDRERASEFSGNLGQGTLWRHLWQAPGVHFAVHLVSALTVFSGVTLASWIPSYFVRKFGISPADAGVMLGPVNAMGGVVGCIASGFAGDRFVKRGASGGRFRAGLYWWPAALLSLFGIAYASSAVLALAWDGLFMVASGFGLASVVPTIHDVTPFNLRGRAASVHFVLAGLLALGTGATLVALVNDYVFGSGNMLGSSLLVVLTPAILIGLIFTVVFQRGYESRRQQFVQAGHPRFSSIIPAPLGHSTA